MYKETKIVTRCERKDISKTISEILVKEVGLEVLKDIKVKREKTGEKPKYGIEVIYFKRF